MSASLPKQHGFQPSDCNQWQDAGVGWVLPPLASLEYLALGKWEQKQVQHGWNKGGVFLPFCLSHCFS